MHVRDKMKLRARTTYCPFPLSSFLFLGLASLSYGLGHQVVFDYRVSVLVCAGAAPHPVRALLEQFLRCKKKAHCRYGHSPPRMSSALLRSHSQGLMPRPPQMVWA